jgi:hypothetical protein
MKTQHCVITGLIHGRDTTKDNDDTYEGSHDDPLKRLRVRQTTPSSQRNGDIVKPIGGPALNPLATTYDNNTFEGAVMNWIVLGIQHNDMDPESIANIKTEDFSTAGLPSW